MVIFLIFLNGLPKYKVRAFVFLFTIDPAPITDHLAILILCMMVDPAPIKEPSQILEFPQIILPGDKDT